MTTRIGIIEVSDRASAGVYEDTLGKRWVALLERYVTTRSSRSWENMRWQYRL